MVETNRIQELLRPYMGDSELSEQRLKQVSAYLELLLKWNAKTNLTSVRNPEAIITRHFGESFFAAQVWLGSGMVGDAIDFGSGAGFPGLPMAICFPATKVTLIESHSKKATFLKEVARSLGLKNVAVFASRGEDYPGKASFVTLRAVENFPKAVEAAARLLSPDGRMGLMIGVGQQGDLPAAFKWEVGNAVPGSPGRVLALGYRK